MFTELDFLTSSDYEDVDRVERTGIAMCEAQAAGCQNGKTAVSLNE